jgi:hypothetical protein
LSETSCSQRLTILRCPATEALQLGIIIMSFNDENDPPFQVNLYDDTAGMYPITILWMYQWRTRERHQVREYWRPFGDDTDSTFCKKSLCVPSEASQAGVQVIQRFQTEGKKRKAAKDDPADTVPRRPHRRKHFDDREFPMVYLTVTLFGSELEKNRGSAVLHLVECSSHQEPTKNIKSGLRPKKTGHQGRQRNHETYHGRFERESQKPWCVGT